MKRASAVKEVGLHEATQLEGEECLERTFEDKIEMTQSKEGKCLRVTCCFHLD